MSLPLYVMNETTIAPQKYLGRRSLHGQDFNKKFQEFSQLVLLYHSHISKESLEIIFPGPIIRTDKHCRP